MDNKYIKELSLKDKKTLSQKALKTCEEVGELAKAILPFDSAPGTNHRFIDKEKILEEIADVYLTNISIAYSLNFEDSEIEEMIYRKALKWGEIQSKEEKATFPLPFEIHITVNGAPPKFSDDKSKLCYMTYLLEKEHPESDGRKSFSYTKEYYDEHIPGIFINEFKRSCLQIGVKPIVLDLESKNDIIKDVMTSSKHFGTNRSAYDESQKIVNKLKEFGFDVLRTKIETVPWHMQAPSVLTIDQEVSNGCYFESHIGVLIKPEEKEELDNFVKNLQAIYTNYNKLGDGLKSLSGSAKLSQNFFKKSKDGNAFINMLTYRSNKCGRYKFESEVNSIKELLSVNDFTYEKVEIEYAVYDTNVNHDSKWMEG